MVNNIIKTPNAISSVPQTALRYLVSSEGPDLGDDSQIPIFVAVENDVRNWGFFCELNSVFHEIAVGSLKSDLQPDPEGRFVRFLTANYVAPDKSPSHEIQTITSDSSSTQR